MVPGKGAQFSLGEVGEAIVTVKNLSDKAMDVGSIVPVTNRAEETISLSSSVYGAVERDHNSDGYRLNEMPQQATGMVFHAGLLLPGQEVTVRTSYRTSFSTETFRIQYLSAARKYDGTAGSLLPLKPYISSSSPDPKGPGQLYESFNAQRWLAICKANPAVSPPGPAAPKRAVLLPDVGEGSRAAVQSSQIVAVTVSLTAGSKAFPGEKALTAAARITGAPPDQLRIAYSVALVAYVVEHGRECWLLTGPDQTEPGTLLPSIPPELLKDVDSQTNISVRVGDKQVGFGPGAHPSGRKLWDKYPIEYGDGMYTQGEFIRIGKSNLREFLEAVYARGGHLGVVMNYFHGGYFTLSIP
jgi:hypothetical protein